ncbi:hypothetical protein BC629DRAFT_1624960 [Irpex lacteus]|nr:hypothetical protein BC629DRAFT_1624960 [Irpex lacteus]
MLERLASEDRGGLDDDVRSGSDDADEEMELKLRMMEVLKTMLLQGLSQSCRRWLAGDRCSLGEGGWYPEVGGRGGKRTSPASLALRTFDSTVVGVHWGTQGIEWRENWRSESRFRMTSASSFMTDFFLFLASVQARPPLFPLGSRLHGRILCFRHICTQVFPEPAVSKQGSRSPRWP